MPIVFSFPTETPPQTLPDFSHELEQQRLNALKKNWIFNSALDLFGELYAKFNDLAQIPDRYFPVTPKTFPELHKLYEIARKKLEVPDKYTLFCTMDYTRNARTFGTDGNCVIVMDSSCLEDFSSKQIIALLGRELGHIKMKHIKYLNAFDMIDDLIQSIPLGSRILSTTLMNTTKGLFLEWLLAAEYTADRAAAIAVDDIQPVMQNHLMTSGIEKAEDCQNYKPYMQSHLSQNLSSLNRAAQVILTGTLKMFPVPFVIQRMKELEKWSVSTHCQNNFPQIYANNRINAESQKQFRAKSKNDNKNLIKGQKIILAKNNAALNEILICLGWDISKYDDGKDFDLDAAAFLLGASGKVNSDEDFVFYGNLKHVSASVEHFGDNLTDEGGNAQLKICLGEVPANVERIDFTVTIYKAEERKQTFGQVKNLFIRVVNMVANEEILRYEPSEDFSIETAVVIGGIYRYKGDWKFNAVGSGFKGGLEALCKNYGVDVV